MMQNDSFDIQKELMALKDESYKAFHCRLMPTVDPDLVLGIRVPQLRRLAKKIVGTPAAESFLSDLPHRYYDENNLHGLLIQDIRDYDRLITELNRFLPYVDNWATCDLLRPKLFGKHPAGLTEQIIQWMESSHAFTRRFGIGMLMSYYLDAAFQPEHLSLVAACCCDEYYVNMMVAWYFATALAKQYDAVLPLLAERRLPEWTHQKTIQKAIESNRISPAQKEHLKTLK